MGYSWYQLVSRISSTNHINWFQCFVDPARAALKTFINFGLGSQHLSLPIQKNWKSLGHLKQEADFYPGARLDVLQFVWGWTFWYSKFHRIFKIRARQWTRYGPFDEFSANQETSALQNWCVYESSFFACVIQRNGKSGRYPVWFMKKCLYTMQMNWFKHFLGIPTWNLWPLGDELSMKTWRP